MEINDEQTENFEEKNSPMQLKVEKCDKNEEKLQFKPEKEEKLQIKQEKEDMAFDKNTFTGVAGEKLTSVMVHLKQNLTVGKDNKKLDVERDSIKINPMAITPMSVFIANTTDKSSEGKEKVNEEEEEKPKCNTEVNNDSDKLITVDPKTGLLGPETEKSEGEPPMKKSNLSSDLPVMSIEMMMDLKGQSSIKNVPTKVIVRDDDITENKDSDDSIKVPMRNSMKEINLIIPRPNFPTSCEPGMRMPLVQPKPEVLLKSSENTNETNFNSNHTE